MTGGGGRRVLNAESSEICGPFLLFFFFWYDPLLVYLLFFFFFFFFSSHTFTFQLLDKSWSQVGVVPSSPPVLAFNFYLAHRVQQSHCSSIFHRVLLTHALALSASQFVHKKMSQRIYTSMHSAGLELTKLTYTRLEDNLIRHRGATGCLLRVGRVGFV